VHAGRRWVHAEMEVHAGRGRCLQEDEVGEVILLLLIRASAAHNSHPEIRRPYLRRPTSLNYPYFSNQKIHISRFPSGCRFSQFCERSFSHGNISYLA
jgi:hypothetical protein